MVLLSAGIGATPVLAMLCELAAASTRRILWLRCARREHHPAVAEVRRFTTSTSERQKRSASSRPSSRDKVGEGFDAAGRLSRSSLDALGVPQDLAVYLCGPDRFMADMQRMLASFGIERARITSKSSTAANH